MAGFTVGLTGGMGAGKSVVAARFRELGARVVTADEIARDIVGPGSPVLSRLVAAFGPDIVGPDGSLDRRELARAAFGSEEGTERLNDIVHPPLVAKMLERARPDGNEIVVVDAALLAEWGILDQFDVVVAVTATREVRLERLVRAGYDHPDAEARMESQLDPGVVASRADIVIENNGTLTELEERAEEVWREILRRAQGENE